LGLQEATQALSLRQQAQDMVTRPRGDRRL